MKYEIKLFWKQCTNIFIAPFPPKKTIYLDETAAKIRKTKKINKNDIYCFPYIFLLWNNFSGI
jgi:hypothetical protein